MTDLLKLNHPESSPIHTNGGSRTNGRVANGLLAEEYGKLACGRSFFIENVVKFLPYEDLG